MEIKITCPVEKSVRFSILFLIAYSVIQLVGILTPQSRHFFELLIPVSIMINLIILFLFHKPWDKLHILFFSGVALFSFLIEAFGANTGILFGEFVYGETLFLKIFNTPVVIGFYWLLLVYGAVHLIRSIPSLRKFTPLIVGVVIVLFDFALETVAMNTGMWTWIFNDIPLRNSAMWFVVSASIASLFELLDIKTESKVAGVIFILQFISIAILCKFLG